MARLVHELQAPRLEAKGAGQPAWRRTPYAHLEAQPDLMIYDDRHVTLPQRWWRSRGNAASSLRPTSACATAGSPSRRSRAPDDLRIGQVPLVIGHRILAVASAQTSASASSRRSPGSPPALWQRDVPVVVDHEIRLRLEMRVRGAPPGRLTCPFRLEPRSLQLVDRLGHARMWGRRQLSARLEERAVQRGRQLRQGRSRPVRARRHRSIPHRRRSGCTG